MMSSTRPYAAVKNVSFSVLVTRKLEEHNVSEDDETPFGTGSNNIYGMAFLPSKTEFRSPPHKGIFDVFSLRLHTVVNIQKKSSLTR